MEINRFGDVNVGGLGGMGPTEGPSGGAPEIPADVGGEGGVTPFADMRATAVEMGQTPLLDSVPKFERNKFPQETLDIGIELSGFGGQELKEEELQGLQTIHSSTVLDDLQRRAV